MTKGILYILYSAEGWENISDASLDGSRSQHFKSGRPKPLLKSLNNSISSVRKFCNLPITVYTNLNLNLNFKNIQIEKRTYDQNQDKTSQKLFWLKDLPYDITVFIDVDTIFLDSPEQLISDDYDLAICREHRSPKKTQGHHRYSRGFNTGFFIAKKSKVYDELIDRAIDVYSGKLPSTEGQPRNRENRRRYQLPMLWSDQWAINNGLEYVFDITIKILPQKWNVRPLMKGKIKDAKMIHEY